MYLYVRMLVMMAVSLFTFRELLKLLGVEDYGTYNVVAGIVILFSFLGNALTQSNQRFLAYHLGKNDLNTFRKTFSMILNVQFILIGFILLFAETVGLWFLNSKMNFDGENMMDVNIVYQFSILTFIIQLIQIPYISAITSYEKMSFFSYFSIGEAFLRLGVVFSLNLFAENRLIVYAVLLSVSAFMVLLVNYFYCNKSLVGCKYMKLWDKNLLVKLTSFSGWNVFAGMGNVAAGQGINILLNIFCGVIVNAAMGISHQVTAAVTSLGGNMQMAFNPQIIKAYAAHDMDYFNSLIFRASRISFYLIMLVGLPILICANSILDIWLDDVPVYAVVFTQLSIIYCMADSISTSLWVGIQASGKITAYSIILTILLLLNLPIDYVVLKMGFSPECVLLVRIILCIVIHLFRIIYLNRICEFKGVEFLKKITLKAILFVFMSIPLPVYLSNYLSTEVETIFLGLFTFIEVGVFGFVLLLTHIEKDFLIGKVKSILRHVYA